MRKIFFICDKGDKKKKRKIFLRVRREKEKERDIEGEIVTQGEKKRDKEKEKEWLEVKRFRGNDDFLAVSSHRRLRRFLFRYIVEFSLPRFTSFSLV